MAKQVILWSAPRSACHLLERMLSKQDSVTYVSHPFVYLWFHRLKLLDKPAEDPARWSEDYASEYRKLAADAVTTWETALEESKEKNETLWLHSHPNWPVKPDVVYQLLQGKQELNFETQTWAVGPEERNSNPTFMPDRILLAGDAKPVFTIRHPALMYPSIHRVFNGYNIAGAGAPFSRDNASVVANLVWARGLYDWYRDNDVQPLVLDAADFQTSPDFVRQVCLEIGFDPAKVITTWPKTSDKDKEALPPSAQKVLSTLLNSEGLQPGRGTRNLDVAQEEQKWKAEFGEDEAAFVKGLVEQAMPHYEYLHARKFHFNKRSVSYS